MAKYHFSNSKLATSKTTFCFIINTTAKANETTDILQKLATAADS